MLYLKITLNLCKISPHEEKTCFCCVKVDFQGGVFFHPPRYTSIKKSPGINRVKSLTSDFYVLKYFNSFFHENFCIQVWESRQTQNLVCSSFVNIYWVRLSLLEIFRFSIIFFIWNTVKPRVKGQLLLNFKP